MTSLFSHDSESPFLYIEYTTFAEFTFVVCISIAKLTFWHTKYDDGNQKLGINFFLHNHHSFYR